MDRFFSPHADLVLRAIMLGVFLLFAGGASALLVVEQSPYVTRQHVVVEQPVPFSHEHHVSGLGLDCRYCHTSAEQSPFAGVPPTKTCMSCHSQIWTNAAALAPVRESWSTGTPIAWKRVHAIPDFVYFDHSAHVNKGVGCATCHGPVQEMPLVSQWSPMTMQWCLECHREPERYLRPRSEVWNMTYVPPSDQLALGSELKKRYDVRPRAAMESCGTCHR
jgi:hypothetical protein